VDNKTYSELVNAGHFPEEPLVPLDAPFVNQNGGIQNLLLSGFTSAAVIESNRGALRANHYHKTDWHYTYIIDGTVWYYWKGAPGTPTEKEESSAIFHKGEVFFTPPMMIHAMFFPDRGRILTLAKNARDHESHEADLVRVEIIRATEDSFKSSGWRITWVS
jgi:quercetin dioxygenase-like cupin family protein